MAKPDLVVGDRSLGEGDDLGRRTVIDLELEDPGTGMPLGKLEDVVVVGPAEPIDRLGVVADGREIARAGRRDGLDDLDLNGVGVLHLVDQDVAKHPRLGGPLIGKLADQPAPLEQQVVVVHANWRRSLRRAYAAATASICACHSSSPGLAFGDDLGERTVDVGAES